MSFCHYHIPTWTALSQCLVYPDPSKARLYERLFPEQHAPIYSPWLGTMGCSCMLSFSEAMDEQDMTLALPGNDQVTAGHEYLLTAHRGLNPKIA